MCNCSNFHFSCPPRQQAPIRPRKLLKDYLCIDWMVPAEETQTIYQAYQGDVLFAAGFVRYDSGGEVILVRFFLDNQLVGQPIYVFKGSSVAFSYTEFNRITVTCIGEPDDEMNSCNGQLSIVTRVPY